MEEKKVIESKLYRETVKLFRKRPREMKVEQMAIDLELSEAFINNLASTSHTPSVVNLEKLFLYLGGKFSDLEE